MLVFCCWVCSPTKADEPPIIEHQIVDDGYAEVAIQFPDGFPLYGRHFFTSYMYANGIVGFLSVDTIPGTGITHDGYCCQGIDFSKTNYTDIGPYNGVRFDYVIAPLHTDLIDIGADTFYTQGDETFQSYFWSASEYYNAANKNIFDLTLFPHGNIRTRYESIEISNHNVSIAVVGDLSAGEYEQFYYHASANSDGMYWNTTMDTPVAVDTGASICSQVPGASYVCLWEPESYADSVYNAGCNATALYDSSCPGYAAAYFLQQCGLTSLYDPACSNYETAYLDNQCLLDASYSPYCPGYQNTIILEEELEPIDIEEEIIFTLPPIEAYVELDMTPLDDYTIITEIFNIEIPETELQEITQAELIAEVEAEIEAFLEPIPEVELEIEVEEIPEEIEEPIEETIEEPVEEIEEVEEEIVEPVEEIVEEDEPEIMLAEAEVVPEKKVEKKKTTKKDKLRQIITDKLKKLGEEMSAAATLDEQKNLQQYILALLNYNQGFGAYNTSLADGSFYQDKPLYPGNDYPDKDRRNNLAQQLLHTQMVNLQYGTD